MQSTSDYKHIVYEKTGSTAWVTFNRPEKLNAFNALMWHEMADALDKSDADDEIRAIVLTGTGRAFSVGDDLADFNPHVTQGTVSSLRRLAKMVQAHIAIPERIGKPVIAMVNGYALGGGCELVITCDLAIAADTAKFSLPELKVGGFPPLAPARLVDVAGPKRAFSMMLFGDMITADEAAAYGIVNKVAPAAQLREAAQEMAERIATLPPISVNLLKAVVTSRLGQVGAELCCEAGTTIMGTEDSREGSAAFLEKRPPRYRGR